MAQESQGKEGGGVNLGRHQAQCTICSSPYRQQIEEEWVSWRSPAYFQDTFEIHRYTLYRHAHAFDLFSKRRKNVSRALEMIVERGEHTQMTGSVILSAIKALAKMNGAGEGGEPVQRRDPKKLFEQMSPKEREDFVRDGALPDWFSEGLGTTPSQGQEAGKGEPSS